MFDFKYHIVSLVAVFLALGIGVVMGSMTAEQGVVTEQERALITTMERDFENLRAENSDLTNQVAMDVKFQEAATMLLVDTKLNGANVAVIITGNVESGTTKSLQATLELAGAKVQSVTTFSGRLGLDNKNSAKKVADLVGGSPQGEAATRDKALAETARWIVSGENPQGITDLAGAGFLKSSGSYDIPVQAVIIIGGTENNKNLPPDKLDEQLLKTLKSLPVTVVGAESSTVKNSYMKAYQDLGISTVDDIDTAPGRVAAVYILSGQTGDFGEKATADALLPEPVKSP